MLLAAAVVARADHFNASYLDNALGVWEQDGVWSTAAYPDNGHTIPGANGQPVPGPNPTYDVLISIPTPCTLGIWANVQTVNILNGSTLNLANNVRLNAATGLGNAGLITLNATGNASHLRIGHPFNVVNTGVISMSDNAGNVLSAANNHGDLLTVSPGGVIRGAGAINHGFFGNAERLLNILNEGLIEAVWPNNALQIGLAADPTVGAHLTNVGTVGARGSGVLRIHSFSGSGNVFNQGGTIAAVEQGTVRVMSGVTITGGILATSGNGTIRGEANVGARGGAFANVTNNGVLAIGGNNENVTLLGSFLNNGIVRMEGGSGNTVATLRSGNASISGPGSVTMSDSLNNRIQGDLAHGDALTIADGATMQGAGFFNFSGSGNAFVKVINDGLINANQPSGISLRVANQFNSPMTNTGTVRASSGSEFRFLSFGGATNDVVTNNGGLIEALDGGTVRIGEKVTIEGGTVSSTGTGRIRGHIGGGLRGGTLSNVSNTGTVAIGGSENLTIAGSFSNYGTLRMDATAGNPASLYLGPNTTLSGPGPFTLSNSTSNVLYGANTGDNVSLGTGIALRGSGQINNGFGPFMNLTNRGLIESTGFLYIGLRNDVGSNMLNAGTVRAGSGATLQFDATGAGSTVTNHGSIEALSGGAVNFTAAVRLTNYDAAGQTLTGGTYVADNGTLSLSIGPVATNAGTVVLSGPSSVFTPINSIRQNNGTFVVTNGRQFTRAQFEQSKTEAAATTFPNAGTMIIGRDSSVTINNDYSQGQNGKLEIVIGSSQPPALNVSGTAALAGTLEVKLAEGYTPPAGQTFQLLNAATRTGGFTQVIGANVSYTANGFSVEPTGNNTTALQLLSAVSRKTHGPAGALDIPLPLTGAPAVECRSSGGNHTLVFTFSNDIVSGNVSASHAGGSVSAARSIAGRTLTVDLAGVPDATQVSVNLSNVTDVHSQVLPATTVAMRALVGDTSGNSGVNATDIGQTKAGAGAPVTQANCRLDVTVNGAINASDIGLVKSRSGAMIP
jgi:hypothetical protein